MRIHRFALLSALSLLPALAVADSGWVTVVPDNAGFSAEFPTDPGAPQVTNGGGYSTDIWLTKSTDGNVMALVGLTDYWQDIDTEQELQLDETNFLKGVNGTASSSQRDTFPDATGKRQLPSLVFEFKVQDQWVGRSRVIKDGDTVHQYVIMWRQGFDGSAAEELFEKNFRLLPRTRPSPPEATQD